MSNNRFDVQTAYGTTDEVEASTFEVSQSGALVFQDETGQNILAYAPGRWLYARQPKVIKLDPNWGPDDLVRIIGEGDDSLAKWRGYICRVVSGTNLSDLDPWLKPYLTARPDGFNGEFVWPRDDLEKVHL